MAKGKFVFIKSGNGKTVKLHQTETSVRERVMNPKECQKGTFGTVESGKHKIVVCKKKGKKTTEVQAIIHPEKMSEVKKEIKGRYAQELSAEELNERKRNEEKALRKMAKGLTYDDLQLLGKIKKLSPAEQDIIEQEQVRREYVDLKAPKYDYREYAQQMAQYEERIEEAQKEMGKLRKKAKQLETEELIVLVENPKTSTEELEVYSKELDERE